METSTYSYKSDKHINPGSVCDDLLHGWIINQTVVTQNKFQLKTGIKTLKLIVHFRNRTHRSGTDVFRGHMEDADITNNEYSPTTPGLVSQETTA